MEFINSLYRYIQAPDGARRETLDFAVDSLLLLAGPDGPHVTAELVGAAPPGPGARPRPALAVGRPRHWSAWKRSPWWCRSTARCATASRSAATSARTEAVAAALASPRVAAELVRARSRRR